MLQTGKSGSSIVIQMLNILDWSIIIGFLLLSLAIGLYYRKGAGKSIGDFFLGGRNLPWYIAGISMVATTFAADTPLAVSELVAQGGIAKNWLWWSFLFGGALTTFFFAMLWRRANILTELEFIQLRYEGKPAFYLRLFKSVYLGLFMNAIIIAWVNLAMMSLIEIFFETSSNTAFWITAGMMVLAMSYSALSGLKGVAITDTVQFAIAMIGCIILSVIVVNSDRVGGISNLKEALPNETFSFYPTIGNTTIEGSDLLHGFGLTIGSFLAFIGIQWWASWYPGAEPGGGGYIAQRMMSTRSEKDAVWATLLFQVGHYCLRPWPWIVVGLCAIMLYAPQDGQLKDDLITFSQPYDINQVQPEKSIESLEKTGAQDKESFFKLFPSYEHSPLKQQVIYHYEPRMGFVMAMRDFLPNGLIGLLLVAFIAAYLSTISTQINWGASYIVNDLILPISNSSNEKNLVLYSRLTSVGIMILGAMVTPFITSISGVWEFILQCGAGLGLVLILRWYWWRINAWSEIAATIAPLIAYGFCYFYLNDFMGERFVRNNGSFYITVLFTTIVWISVTFLTPKPSSSFTKTFIKRVKPMGIWPNFDHQPTDNRQIKWLFLNWLSMILFIVSFLFGTGSLILLEMDAAFIYFAVSILSAFALRMFLKKTNIFGRNLLSS
ncbi:MAG: sodium:solute symporter family protein [Salibacteraceae bacterium]